jgi:hypothetical protein
VSSKWSLPFRFCNQNIVRTSISLTRAACPAHLILLDLITRTQQRTKWRFHNTDASI